jgi:uncharacterized protein (TIGR02145 family)
LDCEATTQIGTLTAGFRAIGVSSSIPYTEGNGNFYNAQLVSSEGVTGLTALLVAGTFSNGSGNLTYTIEGTPSSSGTASFALNIGEQSCILRIDVMSASCGAYVASEIWKEFMCHNLGANLSADPFTPSWELIGNYYQWGRNPTCFGRDGEDGVNPCSGPVYGVAAPWGGTPANDNAGSITGFSPFASAPDGAWLEDSKTINDPCPSGFRVPTFDQWSGVINLNYNSRLYIGTWTASSVNYGSGIRFGSSLFLPAAGGRDASGSVDGRGHYGGYWSSKEESVGNAQAMGFSSDHAIMANGYRTIGFSIRCIAE